MKSKVHLFMRLIIIGAVIFLASNVYAATCKFTWAYNVAEEANIEGFKLYKGLVSRQYTSSVTLGKALRLFTAPCNPNEFYAMTAFKAGLIESEFSNELQVQQVSVKVSNVTLTIEVTIPTIP